MKNYKLTILFVIGGNRVRKDGRVPIYCRLTYSKKRKQFATGRFIKPEFWYSKKQLTKPPNVENTDINTQLSLIKSKINRAFFMLKIYIYIKRADNQIIRRFCRICPYLQ